MLLRSLEWYPSTTVAVLSPPAPLALLAPNPSPTAPLQHVARKTVKDSDFGANLRLFVGAGLSTVDLITNVVMIVEFFAAGSSGYACATTTMLALNTFFQCRVRVRVSAVFCCFGAASWVCISLTRLRAVTFRVGF